MKYIHKYYWFGARADGSPVRLDIYEKVDDSVPEPEEITVPRISTFAGATLTLQGSDADAYSPIIKTSLTFRMADAWDIPDTHKRRRQGHSIIDYDFEKFGHWEEFYTPDATKFKVVFEDAGVVRWTGYVTPDSYAEDLNYRGMISVVARDNIGHLADFDFDATGDADGMLTIRQLVNAALAKIDFAMTLKPFELDLQVADTNNNEFDIDAARLNVSALRGKNWYEALEGVLEAYCLCLRYDDNNSFVLCSLRQLPYKKGQQALARKEIQFTGGSGHREIVPMVKRIIETVKYDIDASPQALWPATSVGDTPVTHRMRIESNAYAPDSLLLYNEFDAVAWPIENDAHWSNRTGKPSALRQVSCDAGSPTGDIRNLHLVDLERDNWKKASFIAANVLGENQRRIAIFETNVQRQDVTLKVALGKPVVIRRATGAAASVLWDIDYMEGFYPYNWLILKTVEYAVSFTHTDTSDEYFWNGNTWVQGEQILTEEISDGSIGHSDTGEFSIQLAAGNLVDGTLRLYVRGVWYKQRQTLKQTDSSGIDLGIFARLSALEISDNLQDSLPKSDKTTTIYDDAANVEMKRNLDYGTMKYAKEMALPNIVRNIVYGPKNMSGMIAPVSEAIFKEDGGDYQKFSVLAAKMLLCYRGKANNLITGDLHVEDPRFNDIYTYKGRQHLLTGGDLDIVNRRMTGATLHEFVFYEDLWFPHYKITLVGTGRNEFERAVLKDALQGCLGVSAEEAEEMLENAPTVIAEYATKAEKDYIYDYLEIYSGVLLIEDVGVVPDIVVE